MLSEQEYVRQSLELNLFFMRIAKEHSIFLEAGFTTKDHNLIQYSDQLKDLFSQLLIETINLSHGIISNEVAKSGELVTDLTLTAEAQTEFYSGISIDSRITKLELSLSGGPQVFVNPYIVREVFLLNQKALNAAHLIAAFKAKVLQDVTSCKLFTTNYPLLIDHILREAQFYIRMLLKLQSREDFDMAKEVVYQESFWNRIMAEHSKFIRGLLDPTEVSLFDTANNFGQKFDELTQRAEKLKQDAAGAPTVTEDSLKATVDIRDFKRQGTQGLENCKIRSIALPLLGDHVVREANHYIRLLTGFKASPQ